MRNIFVMFCFVVEFNWIIVCEVNIGNKKKEKFLI